MDRVTKTKVYIFEHQGVQELNTKIPEFYGSSLEAIPVLKARKEISNENGEKITKVIFRRVDIHKANFKNSNFFKDFKNDQAYTHKKLMDYFSSRKDLDEKELMKNIKQQIYFYKGPKTKENQDKLKALIEEKTSLLENEEEFVQKLNPLKLKFKKMNDSLSKNQDIKEIKNKIDQLEKELTENDNRKNKIEQKIELIKGADSDDFAVSYFNAKLFIKKIGLEDKNLIKVDYLNNLKKDEKETEENSNPSTSDVKNMDSDVPGDYFKNAPKTGSTQQSQSTGLVPKRDLPDLPKINKQPDQKTLNSDALPNNNTAQGNAYTIPKNSNSLSRQNPIGAQRSAVRQQLNPLPIRSAAQGSPLTISNSPPGANTSGISTSPPQRPLPPIPNSPPGANTSGISTSPPQRPLPPIPNSSL